MVGISSTKRVSPVYAEKEVTQISSIAAQTIPTTAFTAITGWTITIPSSGTYEIKASGNVTIVPVASTEGGCFLRLAVDGVTDIETEFVCMERTATVAAPTSYHHFEMSKILVLTAGQVITLWGRKNNAGETDSVQFSGSKLSAQKLESVVPISNRSLNLDYSTTETNTGLTWIDGKAIYRIVWSGTTGAGANSTLALGFIIDSICPPMKLSVNSSTFGWIGPEGTANLGVYFTNTTKNNITFYHNAAHLQSRPYRLVLEYTK